MLIRMPPVDDSQPSLLGALNDLSGSRQAKLRKQLAQAERRIGGPLRIVITDDLHHQSIAEFAQTQFDEQRLGQGDGNPILLAVAVRKQKAAIETGKGPAGIVPEMDARDILARLTHRLSRRTLGDRLEGAIRAIVASAEATQARRRPLPPDPDDVDAQAVGRAAENEGRGDAGVAAHTEGTPDADVGGVEGDAGVGSASSPSSSPKGRSHRLPFAAAAAVLVLLGLSLRRRNQLAAERKAKLDKPPPRVADKAKRKF